MSLLKRFLASLSLLSFFLNPLAAYAQMIPQGDAVNTSTLLSASDYGITEPATELPAERTLRTATFDLGNGKRAQVSVSPDLFTHHPEQPDTIVFTSSKGVRNENTFNFDYLPQDTRVSFDLTKPSYTLIKGTHSFTLSFPTESSIAGTILNDHQVSYPLSENATLIWTVDGANVKKEIFVKNNGTAHFEFAIDSNLVKTLSDNSVILSDGSKEIFRTEKPYLLTTDYSPLLNSVSLIENSSGQYEYVYDESALPEEYILDPSAGPNSPGTVANQTDSGMVSWTNLNNAKTQNDTYASANSLTGYDYSDYLETKNYGFSIPDGSTINGVKVDVDRYAEGGNVDDYAATLGISGSTMGDDKKKAWDAYWETSDTNTYVSYGSSSDTWGNSLTPSDVNNSTFAFYFSGAHVNGDPSSTLYVDHIRMTIYYQDAPVNCFAPVECGTTLYGCVGGVCQGCTQNSECASGSCNTGTGECQGTNNGGSCSMNSDCLSGACINGYCTGVCGTTCASMTLPSGYGIMKQSDNSIISFTSLTSASTPVWIVKDPTGVKTKIMSLALARYSGGVTCDYSGFTVDTDTSTYKSVFHDGSNNLDFGNGGRKYSLYIPKSASHDRVRLCSAKTSIGCTSSDSWSFLANDAGSIVSTNGGFNTSGITVSVSGGYWIVTGLTGTSGQGESSGGGGGGGDVPEFSTIGLLILLGGCYMMVRKNEMIA